MPWQKNGIDTLFAPNADCIVELDSSLKFNVLLGNDLGLSSFEDQTKLRLGFGITDTGTNYADRINSNGGGESLGPNRSSIRLIAHAATSTDPTFTVTYLVNIATEEKLCIYFGIQQNIAGAANIPTRTEGVGKWVNVVNQADFTTLTTASAVTLATDTNLSVLSTD